MHFACFYTDDYEMEMEVLKDMLDRKSFSSNPSTPIRTGKGICEGIKVNRSGGEETR